jgi:hypothetical protein
MVDIPLPNKASGVAGAFAGSVILSRNTRIKIKAVQN